MMQTRAHCSHRLQEFRWRRSGPGAGLPFWSKMACERVISAGRKLASTCVSSVDAQLQRFLAVSFLPTQLFAGLQSPY